MLRHLAKAVAILGTAAVPALAQRHPGSHARPASHDSLHHAPMDSAQHAALHALVHGMWTGTISDHGTASPFSMSIAHDSIYLTLMHATTTSPITLGTGQHMTSAADTVHWIQDVSGVACPATAALRASATSNATPTMEGAIACPGHALRFTLTKKAE